MIKKILYFFLAIVVVLFLVLAYNGLFRTVEVTEKAVPFYSLMTLDFKGPYHEIGHTFEELSAKCDQAGVAKNLIGIYFDNPDEVPEENLRSKACVIANNADSLKLAKLGCKAYHLPGGDAMTVNWNYTNGIEMMIGIIKSYSALGEYSVKLNCREQVGHVYEKYSQDGVEFVFLKDNATMAH